MIRCALTFTGWLRKRRKSPKRSTAKKRVHYCSEFLPPKVQEWLKIKKNKYNYKSKQKNRKPSSSRWFQSKSDAIKRASGLYLDGCLFEGNYKFGERSASRIAQKGHHFWFCHLLPGIFLQIGHNIFKTVARQEKNLKILGQSFTTIQSERDRTDCIWQKIIGWLSHPQIFKVSDRRLHGHCNQSKT